MMQAEDHGIDAEMQEQEVLDFNIDWHDVGNQLAVIDYIEDIHTFYQNTEVSSHQDML
jgi:cyclin B